MNNPDLKTKLLKDINDTAVVFSAAFDNTKENILDEVYALLKEDLEQLEYQDTHKTFYKDILMLKCIGTIEEVLTRLIERDKINQLIKLVFNKDNLHIDFKDFYTMYTFEYNQEEFLFELLKVVDNNN